MTEKKTLSKLSTKPVIYVHAKDHGQITVDQLQTLLELGLPLCSKLTIDGTTTTVNGYDQPGLLLAELAKLFPARPVVFLRAGLQPSKPLLDQLAELLEQTDKPLVLSLLSNADTSLNPFAGLHPPSHGKEIDLAGLVNLLAPGNLHTLTEWVDHFVFLSVAAVKCLTAKTRHGTLMQELLAAGGKLQVPDHIFLHDSAFQVFEPLTLEPHESTCPPPFSELSARLQDWFNAEIAVLPTTHSLEKFATLHITHSWGGGVGQWLRSFIETDHHHTHYQLRSELTQSGHAHGQKLSLYVGNELRCPIASWWLQPPIESISDTDTNYQKILSDICHRFEIGRVFISSLIGHSLDPLRTGLPTLQILHDHFPIWPLLNVSPDSYLYTVGGTNLEKALSEHKRNQNFPDKDVLAWSIIHKAYLQTVTDFNVKIAAPGKWVLDLQNKLEPKFAGLKSKIIPHGFPIMSGMKPVLPKPREDKRLRMVILGRMQEGKGQKLLSRALPKLAEHVQVYLLGAGKSGEAFFGISGVDVVLEYDRDTLSHLLTTIGPDFAALLSVVPETFSYTLSELQQLQIPVMATRNGSFPERITHGTTGWLIKAEANAMISQVTALCRNPSQIKAVRQKLSTSTMVTPQQMVTRYNKFCPPAMDVKTFIPFDTGPSQVQRAAADYQRSMSVTELHLAQAEQNKLVQEVKLRSEWALKTNDLLNHERLHGKQLAKEVKEKNRWARKVDDLLKLERSRGKQLTKDVKERTQWAQKADELLKLERSRGKQLEKDVKERTKWAQKADDLLKLERSRGKQLAIDVKERTAWAQQINKDLEQEQKRREKWVEQLNAEISELKQMLTEKQSDMEQQAEVLEDTRTALQHVQTELGEKSARLGQLESDYQTITAERALILQSTSWKITRPLRAMRRVIKNFMQARGWNPLRWPWLFSNLVRNLATQGFAGTLQRLQYNGTEALSTQESKTDPKPVDSSGSPGSFQVFEQPDVSIVIPVYNKWDYTAACLHSLLEARGSYSFEVIVVDDQSSDETAEQLTHIEGIQHLRNDQNLGFVGSCNRGAKHARGEFLVLLNNDTQVTEAWLDELINTFKREPEAGLVGSRLVYPDGSLQESGGIIFSDGSGWNYGRGDDADRPEYHFLREADYCSGACIALKTDYFHQIGGLDERYAPAYYEDTDLAFKVRASGYKVLVQPLSVIIHHEGITSGTDTSSGTKKFQLINQKKFLQRWQSELESQPQGNSNPEDRSAARKASHHRSKGQILFVDATTPEPDQDSGSVRLTNLLRICKQLGYDVTFFADNRAYTGRYTRDLQKVGIEVLYHPWLDSLTDFFRERGNEYDYVFISRHYIATNYVALIKRYCPKARFIFDTVDLHYLREQRLAELEKSKTLRSTAAQTQRAELSVIKAADVTLVVSSVEQEVLTQDAPGEKVHILSNIHHVPGRDKCFSERKDIYFVGGYQHPPNIDAACWFVKDVWPLIHAQLPEMRFHLIGSKAPEQVSSLQGDGVVFHGFVESLQPFLSDCRLAVAPLRYGAGVKGKVNMSMAHGQPVVATAVAGEGMFAEHEREFLLAEDAESFAREVVRLYQDETLWNKLSDASIKNVKKHFSIEAARDSILSLFDSLSQQDP